MATLNDSTNLTGTITLSKATGTKVTLDTDKKYLTKDIELTINAPTTTATANGPTVSYGEGWISAGSTTVTDNNLIAGNIKKDVSIFGVTGTYNGLNAIVIQDEDGYIHLSETGDAIHLHAKTGIMPSTSNITILPDNGYDGLTSVQVNGDSNLIAGNIKSGISIFGIQGTYSGSPTVSWETTYDEDIWVISSSPNYFYVQNYTTPIQAGETYRVTWGTGGTQYISETIADNTGTSYDGYVFGNPGIVGGTDTGEPYLFYRDSATNMLGVTNVAGSQTIHIKIEKQIISSSGPTLIPKTITENGIYYPANDNADGYSSVTVEVGSSEWITVFDTVTKNITSEGDTGYIDGLTPFPDPIEYGSVWRITYNGTPYICTAVDDYDMSQANMTAGYLIGNSVPFNGSSGNGEPFCAQQYPGLGTGGMLIIGTVATSGQVTIKVEKQISSGGGTANLQAKTNITPTESSQTITADSGYDGLSSVQINAISSTYVGSGITSRSSSDLSASGATVTVPAGYYSSQATKSVSTMTLPTSAAASATSGYTSKATIGRSTSAQYINIPPGYNSAGGYYTVSAVANGSATAPASISGTSATVSTGTNTLTLTKSVSVTPSVTAGYISSGTAGNASVSLTASVTTKAAATITPSTSNQTIASGTYLTGTQTIAGDANLVGSNIISGKSIFGVAGTVAFQTYYTGSSTPASSLGNNGDIYLKT